MVLLAVFLGLVIQLTIIWILIALYIDWIRISQNLEGFVSEYRENQARKQDEEKGKIQTVAKMTISLFNRVENSLGKGENAGYQHFLLFTQFFSKAFFLRVVKSRDCAVKSYGLQRQRENLSITMV